MFTVRAAIALALSVFIALAPASATAKAPPRDAAFAQFVQDLWPLARAKGVSRETFDAAFAGVKFDPKIVAHTQGQPEFVKPIWVYLASAVSASRVRRGRVSAEAQQAWLDKAERVYGVEASAILGIWGMETEFGAFEGADNVIRALASLAYVRFRGDYFRDELIAALTILEEGDIEPQAMVGSWAGAMGQTQFMPSSFLQYAVDFDGRGVRDIWRDAPDAIGSTAHYLAEHGWTRGLPWGFEVVLPEGFRLTAADSAEPAPLARFAERGVKRADGAEWPRSGEAQLLMPAGLRGPVFLVTQNFKTIKSYNNSTSYALGVALLGDAIVGRPGLSVGWPVRDRLLSESQIREMQTRLKKRGYDVGPIDGKAGEGLRGALRDYQESIGLAPDGYPTPALLARLKGAG